MPRLLIDQTPYAFSRRKSMALLAYLALADGPQSRDSLAALLWPDTANARSTLRRCLAELNATPLGDLLDAKRETIQLSPPLWVDVRQFLAATDQHIALYTDDFMTGFSLRDSAPFDSWQITQSNLLRQRLLQTFDTLSARTLQGDDLAQAQQWLEQWLVYDPLDESAHYRLMQLHEAQGRRHQALALYEAYRDQLAAEYDIQPAAGMTDFYNALQAGQVGPGLTARQVPRGCLPPRPTLFLGRKDLLQGLRDELLARGADPNAQPLVVQGWPGIGKTTLSARLAHDDALQAGFRDGILWASLGETPHLPSILAEWARALGFPQVANVPDATQAAARLRVLLREQHILLILDDVWQTPHALTLDVVGAKSATLITTRQNDIARDLSPRLLKLPILDAESGVAILRHEAPEVVRLYPDAAAELATVLEGLPLALRVAGRLLHAEIGLGWGIADLLTELHAGEALLSAPAPPDRTRPGDSAPPTIRTLLTRSVARLPEALQVKFALLGVFAPKPATFTQDAIAAVWDDDQPRPAVRMLVARGLLEPLPPDRFQMHALLVMHAQHMFEAS